MSFFDNFSPAGLIKSAVGAALKPVIGGLLTAQRQKLEAIGTHEARVETVVLKAQELDWREAELNARQNEMDTRYGSWFQRTPRPAMGWAVAVLVWKILVWDLALGQWTAGHTDKLSDQAFWIMTTIIIAYFGGRTVDKGISVVAGIFKGRK